MPWVCFIGEMNKTKGNIMVENVSVKNTGLRGITVADTKISFIDGEQGVLIYRGYRIEDLAEKASYPEVASLLLNGTLPSKKELVRFESELLASRNLPDQLYDALKTFPKTADPMEVLQATVPVLAMWDPDLKGEDREANVRMATRLIARPPSAYGRVNLLCRMIPFPTQQISSGFSRVSDPPLPWRKIWIPAWSCMPTTRSTPPHFPVDRWPPPGPISMPALPPGSVPFPAACTEVPIRGL